VAISFPRTKTVMRLASIEPSNSRSQIKDQKISSTNGLAISLATICGNSVSQILNLERPHPQLAWDDGNHFFTLKTDSRSSALFGRHSVSLSSLNVLKHT